MSDTPRIPISVAERIGKKYEKQQVIVIALDREREQTSLTTWGKTVLTVGRSPGWGST